MVYKEILKKVWAVFAIVSILALVVVGCTSTKVQKDTTTSVKSIEQNVQTDQTKNNVQQSQDTLAMAIADGTYVDQVTYSYHDGGSETVEIKISVKDDIVTEASVVGINPNRMSQRYQEGLNDALPDLVVGKKIVQSHL